MLTITSPPASLDAASSESASLERIFSDTTSLSITTSTVCFLFFSSFISSDKSYIIPSARTLTYPLLLAFSSSFVCSPFFPLTIGASICILLPSSICITLSTIWSMLCCSISLPHIGQCGIPVLAYKSLR